MELAQFDLTVPAENNKKKKKKKKVTTNNENIKSYSFESVLQCYSEVASYVYYLSDARS